jgi:hypothetical protein
VTHYRPDQARASAVKIPIQELWTDAIDMMGQQLVADFGVLNDLRENDSDQLSLGPLPTRSRTHRARIT